MSQRRILSLWFPRLAAERWLRVDASLGAAPFAVVEDRSGALVLAALSGAASEAGLKRGQPLRDALAMCPALVTRPARPAREASFLAALRRTAGKYSPWVAEEGSDGLTLDLTGCAHLFGGEDELLATAMDDFAALGLTATAAIADTLGAAWALARFASGGLGASGGRSGDDIVQEARATRSRAARRTAPRGDDPGAGRGCIAPRGGTRAAISTLPVAALRLPDEALEGLARVGIRRIGDLAGQPRAALARRFGVRVVERLDQATGAAPEPVSPARPPHNFAVRLSFPEPIGLETDILAALDRLLPELRTRLERAGMGARQVRLEAMRADHSSQVVEAGLARPSCDPDRIRPLLAMRVGDMDAGFGIDALRLVAAVTEPVHATQHSGHALASAGGEAARDGDRSTALDDLVGRIGARVGLEAITRVHPAESHIPEKTANTLAAAWSEPAVDWPRTHRIRPVQIWSPEPVTAPDASHLPHRFRWRGRDFAVVAGAGPERIAPEWWLDMPEWRSGVRDYWRVTTAEGDRLWLYYAHGAAMSAGWFCQGDFG